MQVTCHSKHGFTLLELLVAAAIIAVLASIGFAGTQGLLVRARQTQCASNLRQIGTAVVSYTQEHQGQFPLATHGLDASNMHQSWLYTLADYLADVDEVRICPADPKAGDRRSARSTSYVLNSYLTVPRVNPFGESMGGYTNIHSLPSMTRTPLAFIINFSKGVGISNDHTHSEAWRSWGKVTDDIQPDAFRYRAANKEHTRGSANYLFVDGHVESIPAQELWDIIASGRNFADPAAHLPPP